MKEFTDFLKAYGVIGLAIAVIIGGKLNELVSSLVNDLVMPILLKPVLEMTGVATIRELNYQGILYGKFLGTLIDFMVIAFLVFIFAKYILKETTVTKK